MSNISVDTTQTAVAAEPTDAALSQPQADAAAQEQPEVQETHSAPTMYFDDNDFVADGDTTTPAPEEQQEQPEAQAQEEARDTPVDAQEEPAQPPFYKSQAEVDAAFSQRLASERSKWEAQIAPQVTMTNDIMAVAVGVLGVKPEDAYNAVITMLADNYATQTGLEASVAQRMVSQEIRLARQEQARQYQAPPQRDTQPPEATMMLLRQMLEVDPGFTPQLLATKPEAQKALFTGQMTPAAVYERFFTSKTNIPAQAQTPAPAPRPVPERKSNGQPTKAPMRFTPDRMRKIEEAVAAGYEVRLD